MKMNGAPVEMIDKTWSNPYTTCQSTKGTFSFWAKPIAAEEEGQQQRFVFTFEISAQGYTSTIYNIGVPVISEGSSRQEIDSTYFLKLKDFILFKEGIENPME
jgi:competence protein ComFB